MNEDLASHKTKCRLCLKGIAKPWNSVDINNEIEDCFYSLTNVLLFTTAKYSSMVCKPCYSDLKLSFECQQKMISNQKRLYQLGNDETIATVIKKTFPEVKTECFEFGSVVTQTWIENEERSPAHSQEFPYTSDYEDDDVPAKRQKSQKTTKSSAFQSIDPDMSLQELILDLRQQNERILRQLTPIQSTLNKTCQNTSLLPFVLQHLKQAPNDVQSDITSYIPPPPIGNLDDFNSFEAFLIQNAYTPSKESNETVSDMVTYYAGKIMNADSRTSLVMGLIRSFMELYFETPFLHTLGWSNYENRIAFQTFRGHIELIKDIINRHSPFTFSNTNDAFKPVSIYFKRMHELRSRQKKLAQSST